MDGAKLEETFEGFLMVSTDSRRMSVYRASREGGAEFSVFIPSRALPVVSQLKGDSILLGEEAGKIYFVAGDTYVGVTKLAGNFPTWAPVMETKATHKVFVDASKFLVALRTAAVVCDEHTREVKLSFTKEGLVLSSRSSEVGESSETVPLEYESDEPSVELFFNVDMLLDFVGSVEGAIRITMSGPNAGALFESGSWQYCLMPIIR
jgi:DNA polymerase-3 subunit beta